MKSQINVEKSYVLNAPLPNHGSTYTVISHKQVIDTTKQMLANGGFVITHEYYRANGMGQVAQGIYHIKSIHNPENSTDADLGMMFAWTNSYDKSIRFQCALGAYVMACANGMVCGELNYARKHTGTADQEIKMQISSQIKNAQKAFDRIKKDKDALRTVILSEKEQAELLGRMFFNEDLISARQMSTVKDEMDKPSFDYQADQDNAWAFYNHVTHAYKSVHPRSWLSDTKNFHDFMTANVLKGMGIINTDTINTNSVVDQNESDVMLDSEETPPTMEETYDLVEEQQVEEFEDLDAEEDEDWNKLEEAEVIAEVKEEPKHSLEGIEGGHQFTPDTVADEEADMIENEEIIEERELEDNSFDFEI